MPVKQSGVVFRYYPDVSGDKSPEQKKQDPEILLFYAL